MNTDQKSRNQINKEYSKAGILQSIIFPDFLLSLLLILFPICVYPCYEVRVHPWALNEFPCLLVIHLLNRIRRRFVFWETAIMQAMVAILGWKLHGAAQAVAAFAILGAIAAAAVT